LATRTRIPADQDAPREIGRGLTPGPPLFDDAEQVAAARELIARHAQPRDQ